MAFAKGADMDAFKGSVAPFGGFEALLISVP